MTTRRVLIMVDGKRTIDELAVLLRPGEIDAVISQLENAGLIQRNSATHAIDVPTVAGRVLESVAPTTQGGAPVRVDGATMGIRAATQETAQGYVYAISSGQGAA